MILFIVLAVISSSFGEELSTSIYRLDKYENNVTTRVYLLKNGNKNKSLIQKAVKEGYKSTIEMYITIKFSDNKIIDFIITNQHESKDYGKYIGEEWFQKRFLGKSADKNIKLVKIAPQTPDEVVGVTGATISSKAVVDGVNKAFQNYRKIKGGTLNEKNH